jgi:hypothetical protein
MLKHVKALEEMGFVYTNTMVVSCHDPAEAETSPNSQVQATAGFLPILEVSMSYLEGASWFGSLDACTEFWQFPLQSECQVSYYCLIESGVYTPTRLIQGSTDSPHAFQPGMMEVLDGMVDVSVLI